MEHEPTQTVSWEALLKSDTALPPEQRDSSVARVQRPENFSPAALQSLVPEDLLEVEKAIQAIDAQVARGIPSYGYFIRLLRKFQVLMVERAPDFFETLSPELQRILRDTKVFMPTENEVGTEVFEAMQRPSGSLGGGFTFDMLVKEVLDYNDVSKKLADAYDEYKQEFANRKRAA
ncbi:MAG: hypothetical protein U0519_03575 [Candidatus Gracilibacteria bacterium]